MREANSKLSKRNINARKVDKIPKKWSAIGKKP
jgi:hypothetical protein